MHVTSGAGATSEFQQHLKNIKGNRLYWCAVVVEWSGPQLPRWVDDTTVATLLQDRLLKTLAAETDKTYLMILPSGDILLLGYTLTNAAYQRVKMMLHSLMEELEVTAHATCKNFDLSVDWDMFMQVSRAVYARLEVVGRKVEKETREDLMQRLSAELQKAAPRMGARSVKPAALNLLFVEDEPTIRQLLNSLMGDSGHNLMFAHNGEEAAKAYAQKPPHMVFLDINLPDISGLAVLQLVTQHDPKAHAVMLTSGAAQEQVKTAVQQGVKGYIVKPFSRQKLTDAIQRYYAS